MIVIPLSLVPTVPPVVIATPTKCGTNALVSCLVTRSMCATHLMPKHSSKLGYYYDSDKYMTVRNPWNRIVSMYNYVRPKVKGKKSTQWGSQAADRGWNEFLDYFNYSIESRPVYDWTRNLTDFFREILETTGSFDYQDSIGLLYNETLQEDLDALVLRHWISGVKPLTEVNVGVHDETQTQKESWQDYWTPNKKKRFKRIHRWCCEDADTFGYERLSFS